MGDPVSSPLVTDRSRTDSKTAATLTLTPAWVTVHEAGSLEHPAQPAGSSVCWLGCQTEKGLGGHIILIPSGPRGL